MTPDEDDKHNDEVAGNACTEQDNTDSSYM